VARYRTPRKKTIHWKSLLAAMGLGALLIAAGAFLLTHLPESVPGQGVLPSYPAESRSADGPAGSAGGEGETPADDDQPGPAKKRPPTAAESRIGGAVLGVGLILMGVLIPVGSYVIDKTSGKEWSRRARKKHPWKRKI